MFDLVNYRWQEEGPLKERKHRQRRHTLNLKRFFSEYIQATEAFIYILDIYVLGSKYLEETRIK